MVLADLPNLPNWPGLNTAFLLAFFATVILTVAVIPFARRRPVGTTLSWGEAMIAAAYSFFVMFLAYGVVPHQWLTHADSELGWRTDKILFGPWNVIAKLPFEVTYEVVRDIIATMFYVVFLALQIFVWMHWQKRGTPRKAQPELEASTFGRPLVRQG